MDNKMNKENEQQAFAPIAYRAALVNAQSVGWGKWFLPSDTCETVSGMLSLVMGSSVQQQYQNMP